MNRVLAAVFTLPFLACSNTPPDPGYDGGGNGGTSTGKGGTTAAGGSSGGSSGGTTPGGGTGGTTPGGGSGGMTPGAGTGGTNPNGGSGGGAGGGLEGVLGHPDPTKTYPVYDGFTLKLVEEFDVALDLDTDPIWTWSDGGMPEGAVRFKKENITFEGGVMKLTAKEEYTPASFSYAENSDHYGNVLDRDLSSGEFRTIYNNFRYGRYEARFKAPQPNPDPTLNGNLIATMFTFRTPKFQDWREIDIEVLGGDPLGSTTNVIFANNAEAWCECNQEFVTFPNNQLPPGFNSREFNEYAFEWTPTQIRWYINGVQIRAKDPSNIGIPDLPSKIMMNLWIFPSAAFGGDPNNNVYPFASEYDWFRFYKWNEETQYPCEPTPTCLSPDDLDQAKNNPNDPLPAE